MAPDTAPSGRVLAIAGSDSGGGAGIQADVKTVTALGGYAATAITALTAQNTLGISGIYGVPPAFVRAQMRAVLEDIGADALKTGMLQSAEIIETVAEEIEKHAAEAPLVVDPVAVAKSGTALLETNAVSAMLETLLPLAALVTPNAPEATLLTGKRVISLDGMKRAGEALLAHGMDAVLVKGGHIESSSVHDVLITHDSTEVFTSPRLISRHTHGTGCTLASAIATRLAQGLGLVEAVTDAREYVFEAIRTAPELGRGHGPLNHGYPFRSP